ncbi:MAG: glycerol kinase [Methylococcus sp.]|jgi:glycerol kinase|nr:MAG: glycerol kinase [Methylococcus sp.]
MPSAILAIDQGTTSTRCILFDREGQIMAAAQKEHQQICPKPGWVEHDAIEIWETTKQLLSEVLAISGLAAPEIAAIGITNQRETTVIWDRITGKPIYHAIVWQDMRTTKRCEELSAGEGQNRFRRQTGLPIATYFSAPKIQWMLDHLPEARSRAERNELLFGTIDSWLIWNLTGGVHVTDPTNASRTLLMNLETLDWDDELLSIMQIPRSILPTIRSSSEVYGHAKGVLSGVPVAGDLGDQQAALFGQTCFDLGDAKNTYGTGCFMLLNTGPEIRSSSHGLLTTVAYQLGTQTPVYALEGSVAVTGSLIQWLRDNLGLIETVAEIEPLALSVKDNGGVYIVPAFSGLFAPHWRADARGAIVGLTRYANKGHFARAALEATAFQTREILDAMTIDIGHPLSELKVDGGMVINQTLMQFQADVLGVTVIKPKVSETTALGAAFSAGLAVGFWKDLDELRRLWAVDRIYHPKMDPLAAQRLYGTWQKAVVRTLDWVQ